VTHLHADEMVQMAVGVMGMFVVHPREPEELRVPRDRDRRRRDPPVGSMAADDRAGSCRQHARHPMGRR
jgi:hypothetical protein